MSVRKYPLTKATHVSLESLTPVLSVSQFCRRSSRQEATLLVWGDIFSLGGTTFSGPNDPEALSHLLESLRNDTKKTWRQIRGQCSCLYVTPEKIEI
ncbi:MAG: hypothetical protein EB078_05245, partial [Proteobacteria bacterium]|nr:hypothetical protein [Pseudomonadota bacterium]NDD04290.1 hypothetical protein [Pseudomonadota bacterium]